MWIPLSGTTFSYPHNPLAADGIHATLFAVQSSHLDIFLKRQPASCEFVPQLVSPDCQLIPCRLLHP